METLNIGQRLNIYSRNRSLPSKDYLKLIWITKEQGPIVLGEMKRSHVQNTLIWCIRKGGDDPVASKDGILYSQWIAYFLARLLDPELE